MRPWADFRSAAPNELTKKRKKSKNMEITHLNHPESSRVLRLGQGYAGIVQQGRWPRSLSLHSFSIVFLASSSKEAACTTQRLEHSHSALWRSVLKARLQVHDG